MPVQAQPPVPESEPVPVSPIVPPTIANRYAQAQQAYDEAVALEQTVPAQIVAVEQFAANARAELIQAENAVREAIVSNVRINANFRTPTLERDIYGEASANALSTPLPDAANEQAFVELVDASISEARTTEPESVNEAAWQRNAAIWDAQDADYAYALADRAVAELPSSTPHYVRDDLVQRRDEARALAEQSWAAVESAFATEYRLVVEPYQSLVDQEGPLADYKARVLDLDFDPVYADRIRMAARVEPATDPIGPLTDERIDEVVTPYVQRVERAYLDGGNPAALDEIEAVRAEIQEDAALSPEGDRTPLTVQADRLLILTNEMETRLQRTYEVIRSDAADHLLDIRADSDHDEISANVSAALARYVQLLPSDQLVPLMQDTEHVWSPMIRENYRLDVMGAQGTGEDNPTANFARITDALVLVDGGYEIIEQISADFATILAFDQENDIIPTGQFIPQSFQAMLEEGAGYYLALEMTSIVNRQNEHQGEFLMDMINDSLARYTESARARVDEQVEHRAEYYRIIDEFSEINQTPPGRTYEPGTTPVGEMELENALIEYIETNPDFVTTDSELGEAIALDGQRLFHAQLAFEMLDDETASLNGAQESIERLGNIWSDDTANGGLAPVYLSSVYLLSDMDTMLRQAEAAGNISNSQGADNSLLSPAQTFHNIVKRTSIGSLPRLDFWFNLGGVGSFLLSAQTNLDTARADDSSGLQAAIAGLQAGRFSVYAGRDSWMLISRLAAADGELSSYRVFESTHPRLYNLLNTRINQLGVALDAANLIRVGLDIQASGESHLSPDSLFQYGIAANNLVANSLLLGTTMYGSGATTLGGASTASFFTGPALPIALALIAGGALASYQYNRVKAANRFETAEIRQALSHIGSLNNDGSPRPIQQVSSFQDHGPSIRIWEPGMSIEDLIDYRGLSANAVDELLNNSSDPDDPRSAMAQISALAAEYGMTGRELLLYWYDNKAMDDPLSNNEQKELPPAAFGVDLTAEGISDESLREVWQIYPGSYSWHEMIQTSGLKSDQVFEDANALIEYILENDVIEYRDPPQGDIWSAPTEQFDLDKVRAILDLGELQPGQAPVPAAVRRGAEQFMAGLEIDHGFRPDSIDGLNYWLRINGYPEIEARPTVTLSEPVRPAVEPVVLLHSEPPGIGLPPGQPGSPDEPTAEDILIPGVDTPPEIIDEPPLNEPPDAPEPPDEVDSGPAVQAYTVQPGDTLWAIAARHGALESVDELIRFHNQQLPDDSAGAPRFEPAAVDGSWPPGAASAAIRDPDLILPGDIIYLPLEQPVGIE